MSKSPLEHLGTELVRVAELSEAEDLAPGLLVLDHQDGGDHPDLQAVAEERTLFSVNLAEPGLQVLLGKNMEVLVKDLAPERLVSVEVDHTVVTALGYVEKLFLLWNLRILSVTCGFPFCLFLLHLLHHV